MGIQHPSGEIRAQTKPKAKYNKIGKIRRADFHLNVSRSETYRVGEADISCVDISHRRYIVRDKVARGDGAQHFRPCESIDSVQNPEAELRDFEALEARPEGLALK